MRKETHTDGLQVTEESATLYLIHHLELAMLFFESADISKARGLLTSIADKREDDRFHIACGFIETLQDFYNDLDGKEA